MRHWALLPAIAVALPLLGCAGNPPPAATPEASNATATGSHIAGAASMSPTTTVGQDELNRAPPNDTTTALEHSSAAPYITTTGH